MNRLDERIEIKKDNKMYKCNNCNKTFEEPNEVITTYESYYGVSCLFESSNKMVIKVCPICGCDEIEENIEE